MASSADDASITRSVLLNTSWRDCRTPASSSTTSNKGWLMSAFFSALCNRELHSHCFSITVSPLDTEMPAVSFQELFRQQNPKGKDDVVRTGCRPRPVQVVRDRRHPRPLAQVSDRDSSGLRGIDLDLAAHSCLRYSRQQHILQ